MRELSRSFISLPPEQEAIRAKCNHPSGTFEAFPPEEIEQSIPKRFEKIVAQSPNRIAIKTKSAQITYGTLNKAANRLARAIVNRRGYGQELVAVFLRGEIPRIIANLAIFKAGKFTLQTSPADTQFAIDRVINESGAVLIMTDGETNSLVNDRVKTKALVINIHEQDCALGEENLQLSIPPKAFAYIKYTSGSTGVAKGTAKTHCYVLHTVRNFINACHISPDDQIALLGRSSIFNDLLMGATLCPVNIKEDGIHRLSDWLIKEEITVYRSFPTAFRHFVTTLSGQESFPHLRLIRLGGEPLFNKDVELYKKHFSSQCVLVNSYGATETGAICHYFIDKSTVISGPFVPVGYPLEGIEVMVVDDLGNPVEAHQVGEIIVKSRFLPHGYWQNLELSEARFQLNTSDEEECSYQTGDLGRISADGCLEHLGRKDTQIKVRGFRVVLDDIEATLADHPAVKAATVIARGEHSGDARLLGYIVPLNEPAPTTNSLRDFLQERLPDYMIPSTFVVLDKLPMTAMGKVDRRVLPEPARSRPQLDTAYVAPRSLLEKEVAKVWADVLSLDQIGVHDSFFELGGHSLAATRVVSQVVKQFQLEIPLQSLFQSPTIAEMAAVIAEHQARKIAKPELERILAEIESISEDKAGQLLADATGTNTTRQTR